MKMWKKISWVAVFSVAFAVVESAVVVYLRSLYYPEGFSLPLKVMSQQHIWVELSREVATIVMLVTVGVLVGSSRWQKFAYFMIAFGVWDIFYYLLLKVMLNWPESIFDWDILFLIPLPWIGPVIAPLLISLFLFAGGWVILKTEQAGSDFRLSKVEWICAVVGTLVILFSFMSDTEATLRLAKPQPYPYGIFVLGIGCYAGILASRVRKLAKRTNL